MSSRIKGVTVEIGGDTTGLEKALKQVNSNIRETQSQLKDVSRLLKLDPSNTELLAQKQRLLKDSISETKQKLDALKQAQQQAKEQLENGTLGQDKYDALQREIAETEQKLKSLTTEYKNFGSVAAQQIAVVGEKMKELGGKMEQAGKDLTMKVTAPIVAAGTVAVKNFAEVDKTMTLANQTMGNTAEEAELLDRAMSEAAANSTFGMSDAAEAVLNFARAGLDAQQAAQALAPAMNLAAGEGGNLDTVSAGLVATINGFGDSFENAASYADVFAAACNNSALDVNSLSEAMSVAAPIFHAAGYTVEDAALYMGTMANNGIDANTAANSLKTGLARLAKPAKEGAEMMDKLGISVFNADGTMKDSIEVQRLLHDKFAQLSEQEQIAAASAIFGKNQMSSWLALINTAPEDVRELADSLHTAAGTTDEMAEAMMGGFGGSIEKLKSSLDVLMYTLGKLAAEYLAPVIEKVQAGIDKFLSLDKGTKDLIVRILGIAAAVGPILVVGGKLLTGIGSIMTFVPKLVGGIGSLIGAIGPWGIAIAAAIAVGILLYKNWDKIKEKAAQLKKWVSEKWSAMKEKVSAASEKMRDKVSSAWSKMHDHISGLKDKIGEKVDGLKDRFHTFGESVKEKWSGIWEPLSGKLAELLQPLQPVLDGVLQMLRGIFDIFKGLFTGDWDLMWSGLSTAFTGYFTAIKEFFSAVLTAFQTIWESFTAWFTPIWNNAWTAIKSFFENIWNGIRDFFINLWENLKTTVSTAMSSIRETVSSIHDAISSKVSSVWESVKSKVSNVMSSIQETIHNKWESAKSAVSSKVDAMRDKVSSTFDSIHSKAESVWENIKTGITNKIEAARDVVRNAIDRMKSFFNFHWSLPHIALPHFSISGNFSLNPPSIPHFSVSWYKKAMDGGMILNNPTIFGMMNGKLLGGGEAGSETVVGTESLMDMIRRAVASVETAMTINYGGVTINVYGAEGQSISELADEIEDRINFGVTKKTAAWA